MEDQPAPKAHTGKRARETAQHQTQPSSSAATLLEPAPTGATSLPLRKAERAARIAGGVRATGLDPQRSADAKPLLRGWLHTGTTPLAIASGIVLICLAQGGLSKAAAAVFLACSVLLFGHSALYHRFNWSPRVKQVLRRIDHANIFLLIAGTYTPVAVGALPLGRTGLLLTIVWSGALIGIAFRVFWITAPRWLYVALYVALGWAAVFFFAEMYQTHPAAMVLVAIGGLLYTAGAVFYGLKWPLRTNRFFGFHELFHALTVAAFFCHWTAALLALLHPVYLR